MLLSLILLARFFISVGVGVVSLEGEDFQTYPSCERTHYPLTLRKAVIEAQMRELIDEHAERATIHSFACSRKDRRPLPLCYSVRRVGMFDVGSTGIRLLVADVDTVTGYANRLCSFEYSMPFELTERDALTRLAAIGAMKRTVEELYASVHEIEFHAVATAGFRSAGQQGVTLADEIKQVTGVHFDVINQDREGVLAFLGALFEYPRANPSRVVVWDIGGGSMQLTMQRSDGEVFMAGCEVAARTFLQETLVRIKGNAKGRTPNPMSQGETERALELARQLFTGALGPDSNLMPFKASELELIKERVRSEGYVLGVGGVHARIVLPSVRAVTGQEQPRYTPQLLRETINYMVENQLDDDSIQVLVGDQTDSIPSIVTSLIFVYIVLELLEIPEVHVLDINNTQGLVAECLVSFLQ